MAFYPVTGTLPIGNATDRIKSRQFVLRLRRNTVYGPVYTVVGFSPFERFQVGGCRSDQQLWSAGY